MSRFSAAHPHQEQTAQIIKAKPTVRFLPYVPEQKEYGFELGAMWENRNMYWLAGSYGHHLGKCVLYTSENCQHYGDIIVGTGGSEYITNGVLLASLRWQFVSFPKVFSPMARVFVGGVRVRDDDRDSNALTYGIGYGFTTSMHENLDFRTEIRVGQGAAFWSQLFLSFALKIDKWVDYYAKKINHLGDTTGKVMRKTVTTTGAVVGKTVSAPVEVANWLKQIDKKTDEKTKKQIEKEKAKDREAENPKK